MNGWREASLGDEIELAYGKSLPAHARKPGHVSVFGSNGTVGTHIEACVEGPGIIVGRKGSVGEVTYSADAFWPIDTTYYVANKGGHNWRFLFHLLRYSDLTELNSHSAVPGLNREDAYSTRVQLPPRDEEDDIANVLDCLEDSIRLEAEALIHAAELKRATLRELLTRGLRGEELKETEIGLIPESWAVQRFDETVLLQRGFDLPTSKRKDGGVAVFGSNGPVGSHEQPANGVPCPTVMVGRSGSVGKVSYSEVPCWPLNTTLFAANYFGNEPRFIRFWLEHFDLSKFAQGVSVPTLNRNTFGSVLVAVPTVDEQREIVVVLDALDLKITLHRKKRAVLDELFRAMTNKLMAGEIHVGELNVSALSGMQAMDATA